MSASRLSYAALALLCTLSPACAFFAPSALPSLARTADLATCRAPAGAAARAAAAGRVSGAALGLSMQEATKAAAKVQQMLITKPRTANGWFGVYFDVHAIDRSVRIDGLRSACSAGAEGESITVQVHACKIGGHQGKEEKPEAWELLGKTEMVMNMVDFDNRQTQQSADSYMPLPFDTPVVVNAGEKRGFLVHTDHIGGLILRGGFGPMSVKNGWEIGSFTDFTTDIRLSAGLPCSKVPFVVEIDPLARGFVGTIQYTLL